MINLLLVIVLIINCIDCYLTTKYIFGGTFEELNPLLFELINNYIGVFLILKIIIIPFTILLLIIRCKKLNSKTIKFFVYILSLSYIAVMLVWLSILI